MSQVLESRRSPAAWLAYRSWILPLALCVLVVSFLGLYGYRDLSAQPSSADQAILEAQAVIKGNFEPGVVVRYAPREFTKATYAAGSYQISGWLQAVSQNGAITETYDYSCVVAEALGGSWSVTGLDLQPQ